MNWLSYQYWWMRIGKRPWTFITRDSYHNAPLLWIIGLLAAGAFWGRYFGLMEFADLLWKVFVGILLGHFFWGSKWVRGQKGD